MTQELFQTGLIFDLLALALLVGVAIYYMTQGFLAGLVGLIGNIFSILCANWIAKAFTPGLFQWLFGGSLIDGITDAIASGGDGIAQVMERYGSFIPQSIQESILEQVNQAAQGSAAETASQIVSQVIEPLLAPILNIVVFLVVYLVLRLVVVLIINLLRMANHIPLVGGANRAMGLVLGLGAGVVDVFLFMCVLWAVVSITNNQLDWLNHSLLETSRCYTLFTQVNPFM